MQAKANFHLYKSIEFKLYSQIHLVWQPQGKKSNNIDSSTSFLKFSSLKKVIKFWP